VCGYPDKGDNDAIIIIIIIIIISNTLLSGGAKSSEKFKSRFGTLVTTWRPNLNNTATYGSPRPTV